MLKSQSQKSSCDQSGLGYRGMRPSILSTSHSLGDKIKIIFVPLSNKENSKTELAKVDKGKSL